MKFHQPSVRRRAVTQTIAIASSVAAMLALAPFAQATSTVINVEFEQNNLQRQMNPTPSSSTVSPLAYPGSTWNDETVQAGTAPYGPLFDSNGGSVPVTFTLGVGENTATAVTGLEMLNTGGTFAAGDLTISGLNNNQKYDLYLVSDIGGGRGGTFKIGAETLTSAADNTTDWVNLENYVLFSRISPISGQITVALSSGYEDGFLGINGFQITESIPEPSTLLLFGVGAGLLWLRRRNQSSR